MNRRHFLSLLGSTFLLTGCVFPETDRSNDSSGDQGTGETVESQIDCTVPDSSSLPSAEIPSDLTKESAESVALSVEESYAIQRAKAEGWNVDGTDGTDTSVETINGGFLVKATVHIDGHKLTEMGTETGKIGYMVVSSTRVGIGLQKNRLNAPRETVLRYLQNRTGRLSLVANSLDNRYTMSGTSGFTFKSRL